MADYKKKVQSGDSHLGNLTSARYKHIDGSVTTPITVSAGACRLLRVTLNTNGGTLTLRDGSSDVIAVIASDAPEQTFPYGIYITNSLQVIASATLDATIVYDN